MVTLRIASIRVVENHEVPARSEDPVNMVAIGTRAFARCCVRGGAKKEGGVYSAPDLGGTSWQIWCGTRNGTYGIASLYPTDDKPNCGD